LDSCFGFVARSRCDINVRGAMPAKLPDSLKAKTSIASGHYDDLAGKIWNILGCECRHNENWKL
jgi:hypothetical protein